VIYENRVGPSYRHKCTSLVHRRQQPDRGQWRAAVSFWPLCFYQSFALESKPFYYKYDPPFHYKYDHVHAQVRVQGPRPCGRPFRRGRWRARAENEIIEYLEGRYISASEAVYRILEMPMHCMYPAVDRFAVHFPGDQFVEEHAVQLRRLRRVPKTPNSRPSSS
jgi:hypothetical protein